MNFHPPSMPNLPRRQRGFSLIELIAAFVVFAIGFGALMQILSSSLRNTRLSAEYTEAALWAQTKLDTAGFGERLKEGNEHGDFNDNYRWQMEIHKYQFADSQQPVQSLSQMDLYRLDLTVSWGERFNARTAHFVTLRAATPDPNAGMSLQAAPPIRPQPMRKGGQP